MKVRITEFSSKDKVFELAKYITNKYQLRKEMHIKLDEHTNALMLYLMIEDSTKEEIEAEFKRKCEALPVGAFGGPVTDEDIPF